jgi:nitrogen-specific signal transduction histidine kinase
MRRHADAIDLLDYVDEACVTLDARWHITAINRAAERLLGRSRRDFLGRPLADAVPEFAASSLLRLLRRTSLEGVAVTDHVMLAGQRCEVVIFPTASGITLQARAVSAAGGGGAGESSDAPSAEADLRVGEAALRALAHDSNNALVGILGGLAATRRELVGTALEPIVDQMTRSAERLAGLTRRLSALAGRPVAEHRPIDLGALGAAACADLQAAVGPRTRLVHEGDPSLPSCFGDAVLLQQLVGELLSNAVEALPAREGTVRLRTARRVLNAAALQSPWMPSAPAPGEYALLEVEDDGHGIPVEVRERLFTPGTTTRTGASGLGLAAVRSIVRAHGGTIQIEDRPQGGTLVRVALPLAVIPASTLPPATRWQGWGTILVIDDEPDVRQVVARLLEQRGFSVLTAASAREGIARCARAGEGLRAVLLDLTMPLQGGTETLPLLRAVRPGVPVILMSGHAREAAPREADGFLPKPFSEDAFYSIVGRVLQVA